MCAPQSRMDVLSSAEQDEIVSNSEIAKEYNEVIDRESAYEILKGKLEPQQEDMPEEKEKVVEEREEKSSSIGDTIKAVAGSSVTKTIVRELTRGLFGVLFGSPKISTTRRKRNSGFF